MINKQKILIVVIAIITAISLWGISKIPDVIISKDETPVAAEVATEVPVEIPVEFR